MPELQTLVVEVNYPKRPPPYLCPKWHCRRRPTHTIAPLVWKENHLVALPHHWRWRFDRSRLLLPHWCNTTGWNTGSNPATVLVSLATWIPHRPSRAPHNQWHQWTSHQDGWCRTSPRWQPWQPKVIMEVGCCRESYQRRRRLVRVANIRTKTGHQAVPLGNLISLLSI